MSNLSALLYKSQATLGTGQLIVPISASWDVHDSYADPPWDQPKGARSTGWWYTYPSEEYELVSWDNEIPKIWKTKIHVPNHQPVKIRFRVWYLVTWLIQRLVPPFGVEGRPFRVAIWPSQEFRSKITLLCCQRSQDMLAGKWLLRSSPLPRSYLEFPNHMIESSWIIWNYYLTLRNRIIYIYVYAINHLFILCKFLNVWFYICGYCIFVHTVYICCHTILHVYKLFMICSFVWPSKRFIMCSVSHRFRVLQKSGLSYNSFLHSWQVGRPETISKGPKPVGLLCLFICVALIQVLDHDVITIEPVRQLPVLVSYFRLLMPCTKKNVLSIYGATGMTCYDII